MQSNKDKETEQKQDDIPEEISAEDVGIIHLIFRDECVEDDDTFKQPSKP